MRYPLRHLTGLLAALLAFPALGGIQVDYDTTVYFGRFESYEWLEGTPAKDPDAEAAIHEAVTRELSMHGLVQPAEGQDPDLIVVTHATLGGAWALDPANFAYGGFPQSGWGNPNPKPAEAVLLIDILEANSKKIVWRGMVVDSMPKDPAKLGKKIDKLVRKLLSKLPPR